MTPAQRESAAAAICARLVAQPVWQNAQSVLLFAPMLDEPDVWPLAGVALREGKRVALPRYLAGAARYEAAWISNLTQDVTRGRYGIREPGAVCKVADLKRLDLVLVPGVAFDWHGRRLGRGKGYYDRLLADVSGKTCGIAFDQQLVDVISVEPHDVLLNCILTPSHWFAL